MGAQFSVGKGMSMANPDKPHLSPRTPFPRIAAAMADEQSRIAEITIPDDSWLNATVSFIETQDLAEEAQVLHANFAASYGFSSLKAAYNHLTSQTKDRRTIYALITYIHSGISLPSEQIQWAEDLTAEGIDDKLMRMAQFVGDYGSHYITQLAFGYRVAVRGTYFSSNAQERESFAAAFKVGIGRFGAQGGLTNEQKSLLTSSRTEIVSQVFAGKITPDVPPILRSFDDIGDFLSKLRSAEIVIKPAPIKAIVNSLWHTIDATRYPKLKTDFFQTPPSPPTADFGVPSGTVLPWIPDLANSSVATAEDLIPPDGWMVCNGLNGTPNLTDRFLMGTATLQGAAVTGGSARHSHSVAGRTSFEVAGTRDGPEGADNFTGKPNWNHKHDFHVQSEEASSLPPYFSVIYIIKM